MNRLKAYETFFPKSRISRLILKTSYLNLSPQKCHLPSAMNTVKTDKTFYKHDNIHVVLHFSAEKRKFI